MQWLNLAVKPFFSWPDAPVNFEFEGRRIALQPLTAEHAATISVHDASGTTFADGGHILGRFLSRLAWSHYAGVSELFYIGSNQPGRPGLLGRGTYGHSPCGQVAPRRYVELPLPTSKEAELALALFREGMSVNSIPFQFLSYFKVLNIRSSKGTDQIAWINANIAHLTYTPATDRLKILRGIHADVGEYLYVSGRCAVAHAFGSPIADPDRYDDKRRLEEDLSLMKEIARLYIMSEFGVGSPSVVARDRRNSFLELTHRPDGGAFYEAPRVSA